MRQDSLKTDNKHSESVAFVAGHVLVVTSGQSVRILNTTQFMVLFHVNLKVICVEKVHAIPFVTLISDLDFFTDLV